MAKIIKSVAVEMPVFLKSARVRGYRSLHDAKINFKSGLNIIIGNNGAGKTNFLSLVSRLTTPYLYNYIGEGCEFTIWDNQEYHIIYKNTVTAKPSKKEANQHIGLALKHLVASVKTDKHTAESPFLMVALDEISQENNQEDVAFYRNISIWHGVPSVALYYLSESIDLTIKKSISNLNSSMNVVFEGNLDVQSRGATALLTSLLNSLQSMYDATSFSLTIEYIKEITTRIIGKQVEVLNQYLPNYSPVSEVRQSEIFQIYENSSRDEFIIKGLALEYKISNEWLPFSALSDGTKRVLYIISQMVSPSSITLLEGSEEWMPVDFDKIIFLEEPELGIHPDQLQKLLSLIREVSKKHQVIMTTHSPQVLNMLTTRELDRITICELEPKKGTQFRKLSPTKRAKAKAYMQNDSYLSDFWLYSNLEAE